MLKKVLKLVWIVAGLIVLIIAVPLLVGWYLSPQDPLEHTAAIVVISGGDTDARVAKGVELYKEGWAPILIFSGAAASGDVSNAMAMKNTAVQEGVPKTAIIMDEDSKTTSENATFTAKILKDNDLKSIILVTSPYHQRRAYELFKQAAPNVKIINQSAVDSSWRKKGWWQTNVGRFLTVGELSKIMVDYGEEVIQKK